MDLLFGGVEGEIAYVERGCIFEFVFRRGRAGAVVVACVTVASAFLRIISTCDMGWSARLMSTFAVAYELGLSRRSIVLRSAGMMTICYTREGMCSRCDRIQATQALLQSLVLE